MKRARRPIGLAMVLFLAVPLWADGPAVLKDVAVTGTPGQGRVSFAFSGDVRFSIEEGKNAVRVLFAHARPADAGVLARRASATGPVSHVAFQRPAADSIVAHIALAPGSTYRWVRPAGSSMLHVDVRGTAPARPVAAVRPQPAPAPRELKPVVEPSLSAPPTAAPSCIVDIPAIARRQVDEEAQYAAGSVRDGRAATVAFPPLGVALLSVVLSLVGTAGILALVRKMRPAHTGGTMPAAAAPVLPPAARPRPLVSMRPAPVEQEEEPGGEPDRIRALFAATAGDREAEEDTGRETSLQIARTFRRGSEEISLARKFHEQPAPSLTPAKMQTVLSRATTKTKRLHAARKMGVGRGEFDLAEKLSALAQTPVRKEDEEA